MLRCIDAATTCETRQISTDLVNNSRIVWITVVPATASEGVA